MVIFAVVVKPMTQKNCSSRFMEKISKFIITTKMALEILNHGFMQRALISGILIAIICSLIGVFLVLRRLSLLGDGLAHVAFGGIAIGLLLKIPPLISALFFTAIGSLGVQKLINKSKVYGESATALVLSLGVGVGVLIIGAVKGFNVDLFSYLFGSILAISNFDLMVITIVFLLVIAFVVVFYRELILMTFNEEIARISGVKIDLINTLFAILAAMTIVITIRAVGILLISSLLVVPAITAIQISKSFRNTLIISMLLSLFSVIAGIFASFYLNLPAGGTIVVLICALFFIVLGFNNRKMQDKTLCR